MMQSRVANELSYGLSQHLLKQKTDYVNWDGEEK